MESDRRPGESERDWMRRVGELGRRAQQDAKDRRIQQRLNREAEAQEIVDAAGSDMELDSAIQGMFGVDPDAFRRAMADTPRQTADWDQRSKKIGDDYQKVVRARMFESKKGRNKRVAKHLKQNKGKYKSVINKNKKDFKSNKGCLGWLFDWK